ncbi:MAG: glycosyl transferase, partial [bacterium]|nr:glycosyl transferase [bacterium]
MIHAFTSSAPNYVGKVLALCQSLRRHCPEVMIHWLVADLRNDSLLANLDGEAIDEVLFVDDFETLRDRSWLFQHAVVELSTAIKPEVALSLLGRPDCDLLLYFDPDMVLFSPLADMLEQLEGASVGLTPHLLAPEKEHHAVLDHELCSLRHGVFNLGFFAVCHCAEGQAFLEWWRDRCRAFCWGDWRSGVFTDQKWVNFAPVFFPSTAILRSTRFNDAPWNINQRRVEGTFDE